MNRIALGTAQFGLDYGVSNKRGMIPRSEVFEILKMALACGVDTLDTAQAYGSSEDALGSFLKTSAGRFKVVTKLKSVPAGDVKRSLAASLESTGAGSFYGVLLHSFEEYESSPGIYEPLLAAKEEGLTRKVGFSLYHPEQAEKLLEAKVPFGLVQVPYNLLDRRFERVFSRLQLAGVEIHVRSIFLQGALLMAPAELPRNLFALRPKVERLREYAARVKLPLSAICAAFVLSIPEVDKLVMGVEGVESFASNLAALNALPAGSMGAVRTGLADLEEMDEELILPQNWNK